MIENALQIVGLDVLQNINARHHLGRHRLFGEARDSGVICLIL